MTKQVIVCVDDEPIILRSLKIELREVMGTDCLLEIAEGGEEAIELIQELIAENYEIPLIISDYIMPGMNGDELLKRVHRMAPKTLKIMLTGPADLEAVANAIKYANLYRYIPKPWQKEDLTLTVKEAINSYLLDKELDLKTAKLQLLNQELEELNREQAVLIAKLHEEESRLRQFLEAMQVGVFVVDAKGQPYYANQTAQEILGQGIVRVTTTEQLTEQYQAYLAGTNQLYPHDRNPLLRALQGEFSTIDDMEIRRSDRTIPVEAWGNPIYDEAGNITYAVTGFKDITERKKAEENQTMLLSELFKVNCDLELALEAESALSNAAKRFVPNEFISLLGHKSLADVKLGEQVYQEMSILFTDIRNFTALSEALTPQENFQFINHYLSWMEPAIIENRGFIDKYMGDAIMALFSGTADDAVKAGISLLVRLQQFNEERVKEGWEPIKIGIGINTGSLLLGTVGGTQRMDTTVISDAVNLASRLEGLTKQYGISM